MEMAMVVTIAMAIVAAMEVTILTGMAAKAIGRG